LKRPLGLRLDLRRRVGERRFDFRNHPRHIRRLFDFDKPHADRARMTPRGIQVILMKK